MQDRSYNISFGAQLKRYSLLFLVCSSVCILSFFAFFHKSFITFDDGLHQQYIYYLYCGKWIRELFDNIIVEHIFELPMWDMSIGMGSDALISIFGVTYPLADPFSWLFALVPLSISEYVFDVLILVRLYLSGLAFLIYARYKNTSDISIMTGALTYAFSATIAVGFRQVVFQSVFILVPLLMLGADR